MRTTVHYDWEAVQSLAVSVLAQAINEAQADNDTNKEDARNFLFSDRDAWIRELWCDVAGIDLESFQDEAKRRCGNTT